MQEIDLKDKGKVQVPKRPLKVETRVSFPTGVRIYKASVKGDLK